ncbi:conserved hypothetical protein [Theileria orientalis strain Shintoku]|uniref:Uncharacterized protein n=1 Tax=Theileria orientalis strain Shintoku TaxID=869250 RepID=J4C2M9_THEOR|nr:conserved hypothetical protein [Theileria orientalis strain Shintoku]PVC53188.1 hypothetical protein MACL_00000257 [Theileria orientalis]BAM38971.1 conserved hypothetical protein [Theileria orientalis strain Shintoku]|eukprot:XP_009689272.1 conserved hypothetical protein [Theileria orientalis strain Shintoku]
MPELLLSPIKNGQFMIFSKMTFTNNICFYLQSGEWNKRTEININKLTDSANNMVKVYKSVRDQFQLLNEQQTEQLNKAENLTIWIDSIKSDLGTVLTVITTKHLAIVTSCLLETILNKVFTQWLDIDVKKYISPEGQQYILRSLRISMGVYIALEWLYSFIWYKPAWKVMLTEVNELKKVIENPVIYIPNNSVQNFKEVRYTLDDFVEKFDGDDSEYTYESDVSSSEYDSEELGSDSEGIVEEYLESVKDQSCE